MVKSRNSFNGSIEDVFRESEDVLNYRSEVLRNVASTLENRGYSHEKRADNGA